MDKKKIRKQFAGFVDAATLDRFMEALHRNPTCRSRLLHWQEKVWEDFTNRHAIGTMEQAEIQDLFHYCHRHDEELMPGSRSDISSFHDRNRDRSSYSYREAYQRMAAKFFPFSNHERIEPGSPDAGRPWFCPACCDEKLSYIDKKHQAALSLDSYEKYVCDVEEECLAIHEKLDDCGTGRVEGLGLYYVERRIVSKARDARLDELVRKLDETARSLLASADLLLEECPPLDPLRLYVEEKENRLDPPGHLDELQEFFSIEVETEDDLAVKKEGCRLYVVLRELWDEIRASNYLKGNGRQDAE